MINLASSSPLPSTTGTAAVPVLSSRPVNIPQAASSMSTQSTKMTAANNTAATATKPSKGKKRTSDESGSLETSTKSAPKSKKQKAAEDKANSRWPWINRNKPEIRMKGTKIEAFNCGGSFFKATAPTLEARMDKLEEFFGECGGDEMSHPKWY